MAIFKTNLKTFESDITGQKETYKVNNAVFLILAKKHKLTQASFDNAWKEEQALTGAKFVASVLEANGYKVTVAEVLENTNLAEVIKFFVAYQKAMFPPEENENEEKFEVLGEE